MHFSDNLLVYIQEESLVLKTLSSSAWVSWNLWDSSSFLLVLAMHAGKLKDSQTEEGKAADREDFEKAALLSSQIDATREEIGFAETQLSAAERSIQRQVQPEHLLL